MTQVQDEIDGGEVKVTKEQHKKLASFARRLRAFGNTRGTTFVAGVPIEIELEGAGYRVLGVNGFKPGEGNA